jgi:hypothetical protein
MEKKRKENLTFEGVVCFAISEYFSGQKLKIKMKSTGFLG